MSTPVLLIIWHSRTGAARQMAQAAAEGARAASAEMASADAGSDTAPAQQAGNTGLTVRLCASDVVDADDLRDAAGYVFCAPENLATLSGAMKEFFDRNYYAVLDELAGRPYAAIIAAGTDGAGAQAQLERIATGWRLRQVAPTLIFRNGAQIPEEILAPKTVEDDVKAQCAELGGLVGATLLL